jgi:hypothetical protein
MKRWYAALISACLSTAAFLSVAAALSTYLTKGRVWSLTEFGVTVAGMFFLTLPIGLLALPAATVLRFTEKSTGRNFAFLGSAMGLGLFGITQWFVFDFNDYKTISPYLVVALLTISGAISGEVFWRISRTEHNEKMVPTAIHPHI